MFIEILFKILLFKGGVLIYAEHCIAYTRWKASMSMPHLKKKKKIYIYIFFFFFFTVVCLKKCLKTGSQFWNSFFAN